MLFRRGLLLSLMIASALISFHSEIFATSRKKSSHAVVSHQAAKTPSPPTSRFSWMLPKTVLDVTVNYTFKSCQVDKAGATHLSMGVAATVVPNAVPDFYAIRMGYGTTDLVSLLQDGSISVTTYSGTDILNSLGSNPVDETATVVGNILGGVAKIAGIVFGGGALEASVAPDANVAADEKVAPDKKAAADAAPSLVPCQFIKKDVLDKGDQLASAQQQLETLQAKLATTTDDNAQKGISSQITALQNLVAAYTKDLTLQVRTIVDPGFSPDAVTNDNSMNPYSREGMKPILPSGLVTKISTTPKAWQNDPDANPIPAGNFDVYVYLDFENANVPIAHDANGYYSPRKTAAGTVYREVAYIPVAVWWGEKDSKPSGDRPKLLIPPQALPFGQFGEDRQLPFSAGRFQDLKWSVTFSQFGEVTSANFASKAVAAQASSLFQTAASTANSIAAAAQKANSAENQATAVQGQADLIYQQHRLEQCQANPAACPSK